MLNEASSTANSKHARERSPDAAPPAGEQRPPDDDDSDRFQIVDAVAPDPRRAGAQAAREIKPGQPGADAAEHMRADGHEIGADAGEPRAFGVAADRIEMRAEFRRAQEEPAEERENEKADHRDTAQEADRAIGDRLELLRHGAREIGEARREDALAG